MNAIHEERSSRLELFFVECLNVVRCKGESEPSSIGSDSPHMTHGYPKSSSHFLGIVVYQRHFLNCSSRTFGEAAAGRCYCIDSSSGGGGHAELRSSIEDRLNVDVLPIKIVLCVPV